MKKPLESKFKRLLFDIFDIIAFLVFVVGLVLFIRFFIFNPYSVVGQSMEPNIRERDFLIIDKVTPNIGTLERGDVIVFVPEGRDIPYIKRIIGLPGETVKIDDNKVFLCEDEQGKTCEQLDEEYIPDYMDTKIRCSSVNSNVYNVTDGFFVLGDNRGHSTDSRCCFTIGCYKDSNYQVRDKDIIGKLLIRLYPFNSITAF